MNKRSLAYSGILLLVLVVAYVALNIKDVQGVILNGDVDLALADPLGGTLPPVSSEHLLGQTIKLTGALDFADQEQAIIQQVRLVATGPQGLDVLLPLQEGTFDLSNQTAATDDQLSVTVVFNFMQVIASGTLPGSTLPGGTVPGTTLPGSGEFKGIAAGANISYEINWTPPVFLDPPPVFTLIPDVDVLFPIPLLAGPGSQSGTLLPSTDMVFTIPVVGAPSGTVLPSADLAFAIPTVTVDSNAPPGLVDLPNTSYATDGFDIPNLTALTLVPTPPSGVTTYPETSNGFSIPDLLSLSLIDTAPGGEPDLGTSEALAFAIPGSAAPGGIASDGTDLWIISKGTGSGGKDQIVKVNTSGAVVTGFATSGYLLGPSASLDGIAYLNGYLWIVENMWRCNDTVEPDRCDRNHRIFQVDVTSVPGNDAAWGALNRHSTSDVWDDMGGITAQGSGTSGSLWVANRFGWRLYKLNQSGVELDSFFTDPVVEGIDGMSFSNDFLYTAKNGIISKWNLTGRKSKDFTTGVTGIKGMAFISKVVYMASTDGNVYKAFVGESVTTSPRGLAYSPSTASVGEALWIIVDGDPFDKVLKVNADTGVLISNFGTNGFIDAPSSKTEGITFLSGSLYILSNEEPRKLYVINATSGSTSATYDLQFTAQIWDDLGGITNDGTNLVVHTKSFWNGLWILDPATGMPAGNEQAFPCCPSFNGARGFAYNTGRSEYFAVRGGNVVSYSGDNFEVTGEQGLIESAVGLTGVEGLAFNGDLLFVAHGSAISKSFLATSVTTKPRGLAFTPSSSTAGEALWVLVDSNPMDKLLKVDPATGLLISTFGTSGFVDAPSGRTEGITFLDTGSPSTSFLWIVANESDGPRVYKINTSTGVVVTTFNLQSTSQIWDDMGGISNDGTNLVLHGKTFGGVFVIDPTTGMKTGIEQAFPCCSTVFGAKGLTYHSGRGQYYAAKNDKLFSLSSDLNNIDQEQTLLVDGGSGSGIEGLVFDRDVLWVARDDAGTGRISQGALRTTVTTNPRGVAFTPTGTSVNGTLVDRALWILVDGDPADKLLKVNPDTGALITDFGTGGVADAPSKDTQGMTFLSGSLWIIADGKFNFGATLYKVNPVTGVLQSNINLSNCPNPCSFFDPPGGISNDGTDLIVYNSNWNQAVYIDTFGERVEERFPFANSIDGGEAVAYRADGNQLFAADNGDIVRYVSEGNDLFVADEFDVSATMTNIRGMVFDGGTAGVPQDDVLYMADSGNIYKAGVPSAVTNDPLGMTYDSIADELYVLVDGKGKSDHVVVVDPNTGTLIRDFQTPNENGYAITYLNGAVYVSSDDPFGPCCGPPPRFIHVLDPNDGTELNSLSADDLPGRIYGMANDGTSLIVAPEHGGPHVELLDPNSGFTQGDVFFFDPFSGFFQEGFEALAYDSSGDPEYLPVKFDIVYRFNEHGRLIEEFDIGATGISGIRGATFVGNLLYVAEQGTNTVRSAAVPLPPTVITSDPKGMTTDGTDLYVVVDGEPRDKILKLDAATGQLVTSFGDQGAMDSPGTDTDGIVYHNGLVYLVTNDESFFTDQFSGFVDIRPIIYDIDPITGDILNKFDITEENQFGPPFPIHDPVGSLASDGVFLYAGVKGEFGIVGEWMKIDPNNPFAPVQFVEEFAGFLPFMEGFHSMVIVQGSQFSPNKELVASGNTFFGGPADVIARFDKESGAMSGQFNMSGRDIKGMTYMGLTLFMADDATNSILGTALPENTVELTIVNTGGEPTYDATLIADVEDGGNPGVLIQTFSSTVQFTIVRNPNVVLTMDSPVDGFVVTTTTTTISGRVNDPSIDEVEVGIQLPFTLFVDDNVALGTSEGLWDIDSSQSNGPLWHVSCQDSFSPTKVSSPICSWRYANPGQGNFQTGSPDINTSGSLAMVDTAEVNPGTELEFFTGYATELHADIDRKVIEVAVVTTDLQGNDVVGQFQPIAQIVGQGVGFAPHPFNAHPSFHYIELEPLFINPNLAHVVVNLSPFAGDRVKVRFLFDAVDGFANEGEGWYLDDIRVAGAGVKSIVIPTIPMTPPVQDGGEIYYRSFSTPFELAEGQNLAGSFAQQPYSPFNSLLVLVTGFVDQTAPNLTLFGLPAATSNLLQTLEGNIDDATFQSLEITHTNANGSQVIFSLSSMPTEGDFSSPVSLIEGVNTFDAVAIDGGGLQSLESLQVIADITPPTASVKIVTVSSEGEAVLGDQYFVVVAASDNLSGVASVLDVTSGDAMAPVGEVPTILVVMHDLGDVSGTSATHVQLATVQAGTPVGQNQINITVVDGAGNQSSVAGTIDVVSARSNRNFFLFPGVNFARLALIPDDGNPITTDDDSLDRLMTQDVTSSVNPALATALGGTVTLGDVMESTFGYNDFGNFILHTPGSGGAADTLTVLDPFQGMIMKTLETTNVGGTDFDVFSKVSVEGFSAQQSVPIRMNIEGVFFRPGELPPDKTMRVGYNLIAPHILEDTLFDTVYRGALIPQQLAVSAITFERRVDAGNDALTIEAEIFEGFVTNSLGNLLKPVISYWTFVVQDSPTNPSTPTITP